MFSTSGSTFRATKTGPGLGWSYFDFLHVASSAWTGLALLARENPGANPYARLETVGK